MNKLKYIWKYENELYGIVYKLNDNTFKIIKTYGINSPYEPRMVEEILPNDDFLILTKMMNLFYDIKS